MHLVHYLGNLVRPSWACTKLTEGVAIRLAVVSIIYNPSLQEYLNIIKLSQLCDNFYLYFNSDIDGHFKSLHKFRINSITDNVGISIALNALAKKAKRDGMTHIIFFDQDTVVDHDIFNSEVIDIIKFSSDKEVINFVQYKNHKNFIINSGLMFPLSVLNEVGFFDERFKIECVDYSMQLRLMIHDIRWKFICLPDFIDHQKLQPISTTMSLFGKILNIRFYGKRSKEILLNHVRLILLGLRYGKFAFSYGVLRGLLIFIYSQIITVFVITKFLRRRLSNDV